VGEIRCPHCDTSVDEHEAGRCLDAWVAEDLMGWTRSVAGNYPWQMTPPHGLVGRLKVYLVPKYSTDIAAAWEVVGRVREGKGNCDMQWRVEWGFSFGSDFYSWAPTAPLAICRAALKAVGE